jgi:caffeoyl-CoA O-methyltransferase
MSLTYVPLNDALYAYVLGQRSDAKDPVLDELRQETLGLGAAAEMAISPLQCSFMTLLVAAIGAKWAVEVGTFTGSSSISIARGLAPGGKLICFDKEFKWTSIARRYWVKADVHERIELRLGNARDFLSRFRPPFTLDFVFIDADKEGYDFYYEALLPHVRPGGLIVFDNMLQAGRIVEGGGAESDNVRAIAQLNRKLSTDPRVHGVLIPVADGLFLCRKLPLNESRRS